MARGAGIHRTDEDDVIQEVFLALHRAIGRGFDVSAPLSPWLKKTTYSKIRDRRALARCGREALNETGEIDAVDGGPSPEANVIVIDARRMVLELLDELRDELRLVLVMSDADDMPMSEIAEILRIPEGTGYTRLRAARRDFEAAWNQRREAHAPHAAALGIAPFLLLDARSLFAAERSIPDVAQALQDRAWSRLVDALGPGLQGAAAIAAGGAAAAVASAAASGATATTTAASPEADAGLVIVDNAAVEKAMLQRARSALGRAALARDERARARELAVALSALSEHARRFKLPLFTEERDDLQRQALLLQQAQSIPDGGHP